MDDLTMRSGSEKKVDGDQRRRVGAGPVQLKLARRTCEVPLIKW